MKEDEVYSELCERLSYIGSDMLMDVVKHLKTIREKENKSILENGKESQIEETYAGKVKSTKV